MYKILCFVFFILLVFSSADEMEQTNSRETRDDDITSTTCTLYLRDLVDAYSMENLRKTKNVHLIKYNLHFPEYTQANMTEPTKNVNASFAYKLNSWYHTFSEQGRKILTLALNYDAVSLELLSLGVEKLDVAVLDGPFECFTALTPNDKLLALIKFFSMNFLDEPQYCYQKIIKKDTKGKFVYSCCNGDNKCTILEENDHVKVFYLFILFLKIVFFLICPWIIQKLFFQKSVEQVNYTIPINRPGLKKTMLIKRVNSEYETVSRSAKYSNTKLMHQFANFRKLVKPIPSDEIVSVNFCRLDIIVDHSELMSKHESPVQLLQYLYANLVRCDCSKSDPFKTCCGESLVGSWSSSFLWCKLQKKCETNNSCRECCPWLAIFRCISSLIFIAALPCLFYIRMIVFYAYEKEEMEDRRDSLDQLDLEFDKAHALSQILASHFCYLGLILCYLLSFIIFVALKTLFRKKVEDVVNKCVCDFKKLKRFECFRMIASHVVLPFEKFGIFGILIGAFYWPIVIPISIILTVFYCIPVLYITGRLLVHERPNCLESFPAKSQNSHSISRSVSSLASCFFLDHISPNNRDLCLENPEEKCLQKTKTLFCCPLSLKKITGLLKNVFLGILLITIVISICIMYAESFGFAVEVFSLLFLSAMLSTDDTIIYFVFVCFVLLHLCLALHYVKTKYRKFSQRIFRSIQLKLQQEIIEKMMRNKVSKENYAFKYFSIDEEQQNARAPTDMNCNETLVNESSKSSMIKYSTSVAVDQDKLDNDNIEYISGRLHWTVNSLALFIDDNDNVFMPRNLFWTICNLNTLDGPGPLWKTLLRAFVVLSMSLTYLGLLLLLFLFVDEVNGMSSVYQVFVFFVCASVPSIVYIAMQCFAQQKTTEYIIGEKILWQIKTYNRSWPVSDLVFENPESPKRRLRESRSRFAGETGDQGRCDNLQSKNDDALEAMTSSGAITSEHYMPLKVDLLITLKDEEHSRDGPLRGSMVSNGSAQSLTSVSRVSPDEQYNRMTRTIVHQQSANAVSHVQFVNQLQKPLLLQHTTENQPTETLSPIEIELNDLKTNLENQVSC